MDTASPEAAAYQIALEHDYVRLVRVTLGAGQKPPVYRPAALAMVRVDLRPAAHGAAPGRVQYADAPPPAYGRQKSRVSSPAGSVLHGR